MFYYAYVLLSKRDDGSYVGFSDDLKRRLREHNRGMVSSTHNRRPLTLVYFEGYRDKIKAMRREKYLKTGWGRNYLKKIIK